MSRLLLRLVINAVALWTAAYVVEGLHVPSDVSSLLIVALVFGLVNALIRPIVSFFTCLLNILTLGLFTFVINAFMLMITAYLTNGTLAVSGFLPALFGGIIVSIVSTILSWFLPDEDRDRRNRR